MFIRTRRRTRLGYTFDSPNRGEIVAYHQAVEAYRDEQGRPRHRVLVSWNDWGDGTTVADAIAVCERRIAALRGEVKDWSVRFADCARRKATITSMFVRTSSWKVTDYNPQCLPNAGRHHSVCERDAAGAKRRLAREETRLLALRRVAA